MNLNVIVAVLLLASIGGTPEQQAASDLGFLLELDEDSYHFISPKVVAEKCSKLIVESKLGPEILWKAFQARGDASYVQNKFADALNDYEMASKLNSEALSPKVKKCKAIASGGDVAKAIQELRALVKDHPNCVDALCTLGAYILHGGNASECIAWCNKALDVDSNWAEAYFVRAVAHSNKGDFSKCLADIERYLILQPQGGVVTLKEGFVIKATALIQLGDYEKAQSAAVAARKINPNSFQAGFLLWKIYRATGRKEHAYHLALQIAQRNDRYQFQSQLLIAYSMIETARYEDASKTIDKLRKLADNARSMLEMDGHLCFANGDYKNALAFYNRALVSEPENKGASIGRIIILAASPVLEQRDGKAAFDAFNGRQMEGVIDQPIVKDMLKILVLAELGRINEAKELGEKLVESLNKNDRYTRTIVEEWLKSMREERRLVVSGIDLLTP